MVFVIFIIKKKVSGVVLGQKCDSFKFFCKACNSCLSSVHSMFYTSHSIDISK